MKLIIFLINFLHNIHSYHIVFEQIGELASSVTYLHVKLTVDLSSIEKQIDSFDNKLDTLRNQFSDITRFEAPADLKITEASARNLRINIVHRTCVAARKIIASKKTALSKLREDVHQLQQTMPVPQDKDRMIVQRSILSNENGSLTLKPTLEVNPKFYKNPVLKDAVRNSRFVNPLGMALGTVGTFMGFYNTLQIKALRREVTAKQTQLLEVQQDQQKQLFRINETIAVVTQFMSSSQMYDVTVLTLELDGIEKELTQRIHWATHAIQAAQNHRLSVDFLTSGQLKDLYHKLNLQSLEIGHTLLTTQHSDLYQLEVTYFFDGENVHLLLHIPCVPADSRLRLMKLHPFPLPLNENFTITPDVDDEILAISPGFTRYSVRLNTADLIGCHSVNKVYLCDRHGVLSKELNNSCLGALYLQEYTIAKELCEFKIRPSQEIVQQLLDNWFLIYTPTTQTGFIQCLNGTQKEAYLKIGINNVHLSPGCQADLLEHRLYADGSINIPTDITHFEWSWNVAAEIDLEPQFLSMYINELVENGIHNPSLEDLSHLKIKNNRKMKYLFYILSFIFSCTALGLVTIVILAYTSSNFSCVRRIILSILRPTPSLIEPIQDEPVQFPLLAQHQHPPNAPMAPLYNLN